jgi:hypothetical protein
VEIPHEMEQNNLKLAQKAHQQHPKIKALPRQPHVPTNLIKP